MFLPIIMDIIHPGLDLQPLWLLVFIALTTGVIMAVIMEAIMVEAIMGGITM
jgi:hypothetical protein